MKNYNISPWELLQKKITWEQLNFIQDKKVLDFGSGNGMTANHFAKDNEVIAIEPDVKILDSRFDQYNYRQIIGDISELRAFEDNSFDVILCHNVFEYAEERVDILREFSRILKLGGILSVLKHNKPGRVMQMVVLLNNFDHAKDLLTGGNGHSDLYGAIHYYDDCDLLKWSKSFQIEKILGMRTFWDLQQNQEIQKDEVWQEKMMEIEREVSDLEEYKAIAFFHHIILRKE